MNQDDLANPEWWHAFNRDTVRAFHETNGIPGGPFEGKPLLLLGYVGAKSGLPRQVPLNYWDDGDRLLVIAAKGGYPSHPVWYLNLLVAPQVSVTIETETFPAVADALAEPERTEMIERIGIVAPIVLEVQTWTTRVFPVVAFTRVTGN